MTAGDVVLTIATSTLVTLVVTLSPYAQAFRRVPRPTAKQITDAIEAGSAHWSRR